MDTEFKDTLKTKLACVAIPVYKAELTENEKISFNRAIEVLHQYQIILFCPNNLNVANYEIEKNEIQVYRFANHYFKDVTSYSKLLVNSAFYHRFLAYQFILIYQLDAYVFKDELAYWCKKNYDYIGAPWINDDWIHQFRKDVGIHFNLKRIKRVGNGGFSLRKTKSSYNTSLILGWLWYFWKKNEDFYWSNIFSRLNPFLKIPEVAIALEFGFDLDPEKCFELNNQRMPFGCHAWEKDKTGFYKNRIKKIR